jgi:hypothetical protein
MDRDQEDEREGKEVYRMKERHGGREAESRSKV